MKKYSVLILFMLSACVSQAQLKHFFPDSNACFSDVASKYWFMGDTVINSFFCKQVYAQFDEDIPDFSSAKYFAAIREDTVEQKVYFIPKYSTEQYLMYDFSFTKSSEDYIDETYTYGLYHNGEVHELEFNVLSVDSVIINNEYRKRVVVESMSEHGLEFWIEGLGTLSGLFSSYQSSWTKYDTRLLCVHIDGSLFYDNPLYDGCSGYYPSTISIVEEQSGVPHIQLTDTYLSYDVNDRFVFAKLYSAQGIALCSTQDTRFDISELNEGVYFLKIFSDDKNYNYEIFIGQ